MCERIETPILLFQAGNDHWVRNKAQNRFVKRVGKDGGDIRMVRVPGSVHEIFCHDAEQRDGTVSEGDPHVPANERAGSPCSSELGRGAPPGPVFHGLRDTMRARDERKEPRCLNTAIHSTTTAHAM